MNPSAPDRVGQGLGHALDAAGLGVQEVRVVAHLRGVVAHGAGHDVRQLRLRHEALAPAAADLVCRHAPELGVVGHHEVPRDALPEVEPNPVGEVLRLVGRGHARAPLRGGVDRAHEAVVNDRRRQPEGVRLEGILGDDPVGPDSADPVDLVKLVLAQEAKDEVFDARITKVQPMAGHVEEEVPDTLGAGLAADMVERLDHTEISIRA